MFRTIICSIAHTYVTVEGVVVPVFLLVPFKCRDRNFSSKIVTFYIFKGTSSSFTAE